jgi:flavorubredoxin
MEILPDTHMIDGINANSYLLLGDQITLVDTGMPETMKKSSTTFKTSSKVNLRISKL